MFLLSLGFFLSTFAGAAAQEPSELPTPTEQAEPPVRTEDDAIALVEGLIEAQRFGELLTRIGSLVEQFPDSATMRWYHGLILLDTNRFDEATAELRMVCELAPDYTLGYIELANALQLDGKIIEARSAAERALELEPQNEEALLRLQRIEIRRGLDAGTHAPAPPAGSAERAVYDLLTAFNAGDAEEALWRALDPAVIDDLIAVSLPGRTPTMEKRRDYVRGLARGIGEVAQGQGIVVAGWDVAQGEPAGSDAEVVVHLAIDTVLDEEGVADGLRAWNNRAALQVLDPDGLSLMGALDEHQRAVVLQRLVGRKRSLAGNLVFDMREQDGSWVVRDIHTHVENLPEIDLVDWARMGQALSQERPSWAFRLGEQTVGVLSKLILACTLLAAAKAISWMSGLLRTRTAG